MFMDNLKRTLRENLKRHLREQNTKKKTEVQVPENCFGGPKTYAGGLVALIQLLMKDNDRDAKLAVEDYKSTERTSIFLLLVVSKTKNPSNSMGLDCGARWIRTTVL